MGIVYRAEDTRLGRSIAMKFLRAQDWDNEHCRARFLNEARLAASLNHPNICTIHEIDEDQLFLVMELVEGRSLKQKIAEGPLNLDEALEIAIQTARGLHEAHQKGIVHRDVKPGNLMLTPKAQVKILDFGLARLAEATRVTCAGTFLGTPAYMSPE
jgi:serine/threonine protein kinase